MATAQRLNGSAEARTATWWIFISVKDGSSAKDEAALVCSCIQTVCKVIHSEPITNLLCFAR